MDSKDKTGAPSIRELLWLSRLRQMALIDDLAPCGASEPADVMCEREDCLPWFHTRSECKEFRVFGPRSTARD